MERWGAPSRAGELAGESLLPPRRRLLQPAAEANARAPLHPADCRGAPNQPALRQ